MSGRMEGKVGLIVGVANHRSLAWAIAQATAAEGATLVLTYQGRFEDKVRRQEALAAGKAEIAASSIDAQFNQLEDIGELTEVEARLAALKTGGNAGAIEQ